MWLWIAVGLGAFLTVSVVAALIIGAMMGAVSEQGTATHEELLESQRRAMHPATRARLRLRAVPLAREQALDLPPLAAGDLNHRPAADGRERRDRFRSG